MVEDGRADAEDADRILLVVDRIAALRDRLELGVQRVRVGDRVDRLLRQAGRGEDLAHRRFRKRGEHRLADRRAVEVLALAEVGGEAHGAVRRVDPRDDDGVRLVEHGDARREAGLARQLSHHRHRHVAKCDLRDDDVAEPRERHAEAVPPRHPAAGVGDEAACEQRLEDRVGRALRDAEQTGEIREGHSLRADLGERLEQEEGPLDALDSVAVFAHGAGFRSVFPNAGVRCATLRRLSGAVQGVDTADAA